MKVNALVAIGLIFLLIFLIIILNKKYGWIYDKYFNKFVNWTESSQSTVNKNNSLESEKANLVASQSTSNKRDMGNSQDNSKSKEKKQ